MKNQINTEANASTNVSVNSNKSQNDTQDKDEVIVITPMEKQEVVTLEYAVSYLFSGIEITDNPTFKQIARALLRLLGVMLLYPIYLLYALFVLDSRLDPKLWCILIVPFGSYWLHKFISLIWTILF